MPTVYPFVDLLTFFVHSTVLVIMYIFSNNTMICLWTLLVDTNINFMKNQFCGFVLDKFQREISKSQSLKGVSSKARPLLKLRNTRNMNFFSFTNIYNLQSSINASLKHQKITIQTLLIKTFYSNNRIDELPLLFNQNIHKYLARSNFLLGRKNVFHQAIEVMLPMLPMPPKHPLQALLPLSAADADC